MKTKSFLTLSMCALFLAFPTHFDVTAKNTVRIGTYNLRMAPLDENSPDNRWEVRCPRLIQSIIMEDFDICGLEEVGGPEQEVIPRLLREAGEDYGAYFFNPYDENGAGPLDNSNKAHGIIWRKDRFEVQEVHNFWISDPPEKMQINDFRNGSTTSVFIRGGFCMIVKDLQNKGMRYFIMVSHSPLNAEQRAKNAHVYIDMERKWNPEGLPSFFVGDLNARESDASSEIYRTWWTDSYLYFDKKPSKRYGAKATFNGFKLDVDLQSDRRIDYIYFRGRGVKPLRYVCDPTRINGLYGSDHFPVYVDFKIKKR